LAVLCVASGITSVTAQVRTAYPEKRGFKLSEFPRTIKLAENIYGYEEIRQPGFTTVSLFVVGNDGVLIADGQGSPAATQKMLDEIARVTPKPVKWYIVGSDHGDHTAGNSVLPKDIVYIVSKASQAQMKLDAPAMTSDTQTIDVGGLLCLHDAEGPCANAVKDAQRSKTDGETRATLAILWGTTALPGRAGAAFAWYRDLLATMGIDVELIGRPG